MLSEIDTRPFPQAPTAFNLAGHVLARAATLDKPALVLLHPERDESLTYADLLHLTRTTATALLSQGLTPGDLANIQEPETLYELLSDEDMENIFQFKEDTKNETVS